MLFNTFSKKFKIRNPLKADEFITQEVVISDSIQFDYSSSKWVAIDTEFLDLRIEYDNLCTIQISSEDPDNEQMQRVEIIWVWKKIIDNNYADIRNFLKTLLLNKNLEILMHVSTSDLPRLQKIAQSQVDAQIFDTKVAGKIVMTNSISYGLDDLITRLVNPKHQKDKNVTFSIWDQIPNIWEDKMIEYAMKDVIYLNALKLRLIEIAKRRKIESLLENTMKIMPQLSNLYLNGYDEKVLAY